MFIKTKAKFMEKHNLTESQYRDLIYKAQQWHNPLNFDRGQGVKKRFGWSKTFIEVMNEDGHFRRFYFYFKDVRMTDPDAVLKAFLNCENWEYYKRLWVKNAPREIASWGLYLLAITEMSVKGFNREAMVIEKFKKEGKIVEQASGEDDIKGIDLWVDGKPVQVKSLGTLIASGGRSDWV